MNGYLALCTGCCGTTRVDFGSYSSMDIVCASARLQERKAVKRNFMGLRLSYNELPAPWRCELDLQSLLAPPRLGILERQRATRHSGAIACPPIIHRSVEVHRP